jgi:FAD/FMN-containing dehydrogenase
MDIPVKNANLFPFLDHLDQIVLDYGGRIYLAKDSRLKPIAFRAMYPRHPEWKKIKSSYDAKNFFSSDLSRRLEMTNE